MWTNLRIRISWLVALQFTVLIITSATDGSTSLVTGGILLLPTTSLLLIAGFKALKQGYWLSATLAVLMAFPGFFGIMLWIMVALSNIS